LSSIRDQIESLRKRWEKWYCGAHENEKHCETLPQKSGRYKTEDNGVKPPRQEQDQLEARTS
jgi:hypothetical protein